MNRKLHIVIIAFFMLLSFTAFGFAQTDNEDFAYGTIASISGNSVVLEEVYYDEDTDEEVITEVEYNIHQYVEIENAGSMEDLTVGQDIEVTYLDGPDGRKVVYIYVYGTDN